MDNNTTYIDNFISTRNQVEEWTEYFPKPKEGKKPLPRKYNYFRRRLYSKKGNSFLLFSLRYDDEKDIFRLRINGSLKKWYFNGNTLDNLTKPEYEACMKKIALEIGVSYDDILKGRNTKIESGVTICLKTKFKDLLKCFVWYKDFERVEENETTVYFRGKFYSFILYEKEVEIKSKNYYRSGKYTRAVKPIEYTKSYLRFEVKVNSVCGVKFYKNKASTVGSIIENWNDITAQIQTYFENIEFINFEDAEKEFKKMSYSELKKYLMVVAMKFLGLPETIKIFNKINTGSNKTKYRNEIFSLLRSFVSSNLVLREELLYEFEKKIEGLLYNKLNTYSNRNNILIEE